MARIVYTIDVADVVVVGVGAVGLLLCGIVLAALWVKEGLNKRHKR